MSKPTGRLPDYIVKVTSPGAPRQLRFTATRATTLQRILEFLGVDAGFSSLLFHHRRNVTGHQRIPNETGRRLLDSRAMAFAKASLPDSIYYNLRNLALTPFTKEPPSMNLPDKLRDKIHARFQSEMNLLRKQCGQALTSLGHE